MLCNIRLTEDWRPSRNAQSSVGARVNRRGTLASDPCTSLGAFRVARGPWDRLAGGYASQRVAHSSILRAFMPAGQIYQGYVRTCWAVAVTWMGELCGHRWCMGGDLNVEAAQGPHDDWAQGPHCSERMGENKRQREFRIWLQNGGVRIPGTWNEFPPPRNNRPKERDTRIDDILSAYRSPDDATMSAAPPTHPGYLTDHHQVRALVDWGRTDS